MRYLRDAGEGFWDVEYLDTYGNGKWLWPWLRSAISLAVISRRYAPDVVHLNIASRGSFARKLFLAFCTSKKSSALVGHIHGGGFADFATRGGRLRYRSVQALLRRLDIVVVLTPEIDALVRNASNSPTVQVANGVSGPTAQMVAKEIADRAKRTGRLRVLYVGDVSLLKGSADLVQAVESLPFVELTLVGPMKDFEVSQRVSRSSALDRISIAGSCSAQEVQAYLAAADVFVLPSHVEAFPLVVLEAFAHGLPVIATAVGALPDIVGPTSGGILVPAQQPEALVDALLTLADDEERAHLTFFARETWETRYDCKLFRTSIEEVWKKATSNGI